MNFNPRSREGSDLREKYYASIDGISIHAPAKGATRVAAATGAGCIISIHAPVKGATLPQQH